MQEGSRWPLLDQARELTFPICSVTKTWLAEPDTRKASLLFWNACCFSDGSLPSVPRGATQAGLRWQAPTSCSIQVNKEIAEFCTLFHTTLLSAGPLVRRFLLFWESRSTLLLPSAQCQRLTGILAFTNRMTSAFQPKKCQDGRR
jgi:hypothetical protein